MVENNDNIKTQKIANFPMYWESHLSLMLNNAEILLNHQNGKDCKCEILHHLASIYVNSIINQCLLDIFEITTSRKSFIESRLALRSW